MDHSEWIPLQDAIGKRQARKRKGQRHTEKELIFVDDVGNAKVQRTEDQNERLCDTIQQRDGEDEYGLRVDNAVVDHRRRDELGVVYIGSRVRM